MSRSQESVEVSCCGLSCWVSSHTNARNYKLHTRSHLYVNTRAAAHSRKAAIQHLVPWQIKQLSISWKIYCVCRTHTQTQILKASEDNTQNTQSVNTGATHTLPNTVSITLIAVCLSKAVTEPPTFPLSWIHTISLHLSCTHTHTHTHTRLPSSLTLSVYPSAVICHSRQSNARSQLPFNKILLILVLPSSSPSQQHVSVSLPSPVFHHSVGSLALPAYSWTPERGRNMFCGKDECCRGPIKSFILGNQFITLCWHCVAPPSAFRAAQIHLAKTARDACCDAQKYCVLCNFCCKLSGCCNQQFPIHAREGQQRWGPGLCR